MCDFVIKYASTVGDLRKAIKGLPSDTIVVQSLDEEGNAFMPLMGAGVCYYLPEQDTISPVGGGTPAEEHRTAICLWPANDWRHAQRIAEARFPKEPTAGEENGI